MFFKFQKLHSMERLLDREPFRCFVRCKHIILKTKSASFLVHFKKTLQMPAESTESPNSITPERKWGQAEVQGLLPGKHLIGTRHVNNIVQIININSVNK